MATDVVIPLGKESASGNLEFRILLRSLDKFAADLGNIWVIGPKEIKWAKNINCIECDDPEPHNKDANIIRKIRKAADIEELSQNFIFASDDQLLTQEMNLADAPIVYNNRSVDHIIQMPNKNNWHKRLINTFNYLKNKGHNLTVNFESHTFQPYRKDNVKLVFDQVPYMDMPGFTINTIYFGMLDYPPLREQTSVKMTFEHEKWAIPNSWKMYAGYNDKAFNNGFNVFLLGYFFGKSRFER